MAPTSGHAIVLSARGTIVPEEYYTKTLIPYFLAKFPNWLRGLGNGPKRTSVNCAFRMQAEIDLNLGIKGIVRIPLDNDTDDFLMESLIANNLRYAQLSIEERRPTHCLSLAMDEICNQGYAENGLMIPTPIEVNILLRTAPIAGTPLAIYCSDGSAAAAGWLKHTTDGDIRRWVHTWLGANIYLEERTNQLGREVFQSMLRELNLPADHVLFVTSDVKEAEHAHAAGLRVAFISKNKAELKPEKYLSVQDSPANVLPQLYED